MFIICKSTFSKKVTVNKHQISLHRQSEKARMWQASTCNFTVLKIVWNIAGFFFKRCCIKVRILLQIGFLPIMTCMYLANDHAMHAMHSQKEPINTAQIGSLVCPHLWHTVKRKHHYHLALCHHNLLLRSNPK